MFDLDCIDDYSPEKFIYDKCNQNETNFVKYKCDNGRCLNITNLNPLQINCEIQNKSAT